MVFTISVWGCGLPSYSYVTPPEVIRQGATLEKVSFKTVHDSDTLEGYEIYYKFYLDYDSTQLVADKNTLEDSDIPGSAVLKNNGYRRLQERSSSGGEAPLISIKTPLSRTITMDFSTMGSQDEVYLDTSGDGTNLPIEVGRDCVDSDRIPLGFFPEALDLSEDPDLTRIADAVSDDDALDDGSVAVAFYVYKQVMFLDSLEIIYSKPKYLGVIASLEYE